MNNAPDERSRQESRRELLGRIAAASAAFLSGSRMSWTAETDPRVNEVLRSAITVDMHNHASFDGEARGSASAALSVREAMERSGTSVSCINYALDGPLMRRGAEEPVPGTRSNLSRDPKPGEMYESHLKNLDLFDDLLSRNKLQRALKPGDLAAAHQKGEPIVVQDAEGADFLERGHLDRLAEAYKRGLRKLQLVHYAVNDTADFQSGPVDHGGLSSFGADVVKECNRLGIVVDVAHCTFDAAKGAAEATGKPIVLSHTALFQSKAQGEFWAENFQGGLPTMQARQARPEHVRVVAGTGGVVGLWHLFESARKYAEGVREMVDVVGVDHVGIGMDWSVERINEIWPDQTEGMMHVVIGEMLKLGFSPEECGKIAGGNFCRVFEACT